MSEIYLIRHGRSTANTSGILAGRLPNIDLDEIGTKQAAALARHFASVEITNFYSSPLQRCTQTASAIIKKQQKITALEIAEDFVECDYGTWSGKKISKLTKLPLWKVIQQTPSTAVFPEGESMVQMANRASSGLINLLNLQKKKTAKIAIVSHADVIKAVLAFAMGLNLDNFQKLIIDPAAISKITWAKNSFFINYVNQKSHLVNINSKTKAPSGAVLGGGAG